MRRTIKKYEESFFKMLMIASALVIIGVLIFIIGTIILKGLPSLTWDMITKLPGGGFYLGKEGGVLNAIMGSLFITAGALLLSVFLSIRWLCISIFTCRRAPYLPILPAFPLIFFLVCHPLYMARLVCPHDIFRYQGFTSWWNYYCRLADYAHYDAFVG